MRDLLRAVAHLRKGNPLPVDLYFRLIEQGHDPDALASKYDL